MTEQEPKIKLSGKYYYAVGRRKRAKARIKVYKGTGKIYINNKTVAKPNDIYLQPLSLVDKKSDFDIYIQVSGGGAHGQLEAIRQAIARALIIYDKNYRQTLKQAGFLTRDPREKERKKPGLKRARRAPQWQKR